MELAARGKDNKEIGKD
ncbi:MAG: hypothetical protein JXA46_11070 [Dehalococcoidales bacterium]|nr:hypothetical protein [Dehalococcoidales bacterium]